MSWHVHAETLARYARGTVDATQQFSVEAHLVSCGACRASIASFVDVRALERTWDVIEGETAAPPAGAIERLMVGFSIKEHIARLLAATPSLRRSWLLAIAAVLTLAVLVANGAPNGYVFFLAVAPLLPLAGIAAAYGPGIDPTYEIGLVAPMRSVGLLLIRAVAVLVSTIVLSTIAALFLPGFDWRILAWQLPSLGLVTGSLALSTIVHPLRAAISVAATWLVGISAAAAIVSSPTPARAVFGGVMQLVLLIVTIGAGVFLVARREEFERGEHR